MTAREQETEWAATIRRNAYHLLKGNLIQSPTGEHEDDCAGCKIDAALAALLAAVEQLRQEREEAMSHLREFNHVEGEPLDDVAAVAASAYGFAKHRADSLEAVVEQQTAALRKIAANAENWHGPPPDMGHVRALSVIATTARVCDDDHAAFALGRRSSSERLSWHNQFARCPECGNATVGVQKPYGINHAETCEAALTLPEVES